MSHSKIKIWVHGIIGTKNGSRFINSENEAYIHNEIRKQFIDQKCFIEELNGDMDHVHVLFLLHPDLSIRQVMKQVKGGSAYTINHSEKLNHKVYWQTGLGAFSVSESQVQTIKNYIKRQKEHHKTLSYQEEVEQFLKWHGLANG